MKSPVFILLLSTLLSTTVRGQQFEPITTGAIATTQRDSRSCNFIDLNDDGFDDVFITNGPSGGQNNQLFLSNGDGTFTSVSDDPIVQDQGASDGASFGDVDNDGDLDAFVVTWYGERNYFYRNNGDGSFSFEASTAHSGSGTFSETCSWGDHDQDGWLDLCVANSTDFSTNTPAIQRNQLWHNQGDGSLSQITTGPLAQDADISRNVQWIDYDQDGDFDLFVSNEENQRNRLYQNTNGSFINVDNAVTIDNRSSTGSSWADYDNDGDFDLFVANFSNQNNQLFRNDGDGSFTAITTGSQSLDGGCSFGSGFADFDNDGDLDLFVTNGFCGNSLENFLYRNNGDGTFSKDNSSIPNLTTQCSFGTAWGDYDNDGFLDLVIANCKGNNSQNQPANTILHNLGNDNTWVKFKLEGQVSNRSAIGAIVRVKANDIWQSRMISGQSGYNGQNSLTVHFGLKDATVVDSLEISWPSGTISRSVAVAVETTHHLIEPITNSTSGARESFLPIKVSPNPAQDQIRIQLENVGPTANGQLDLLDGTGRVVMQRIAIQQMETIIPVGHLPAGVYLLRYTIAEQSYSQPIVLH